MSRYRILYFCMLSMAVSYYVMDTRYLSWLLLVMILLLVPLEVLLSLQWYDAARGDLHTRQVEDEESFRRVLLEACSSPLSERELRVEDCRKELRAPMVDLLFLIHADGISMFGDAEEGME